MDSQKRSTSTSNTSSNIQKHISENFLFRRFTQINQEDLYEKVQFLYSNMFGFNWDSELFNKPKLNLLINLPPEAYFFLVCSNYFPVSLNKLVKYQDQIYETIQKMLDRIATSKNIVKAKGLTNSKQNLIADLIGLIDPDCIKDKQGNFSFGLAQSKRGTSIDQIISKTEDKLKLVSDLNHAYLESIAIAPTMTDSDELQSRNFEQEEILQDVVYQSNVKSEFKKLLLRKHLDNPNLANSPLTKWVDEFSQLNPDDIVCVICSDGDYEDDDLIVYCSGCQLTVHQSCYGITILPAGDWLCNLCIAYSPDEAKNTECVVCSVKGGAMKLCNLRKKSAFKQKIWSQRIRDLDNNEMELEPEMQSPNQNKTNKVNECNTNNTPKIHDTEIIQTPKKSECEDPSDDKNQETIPKLQILNTLQTKALSSPEMNYDNSSKINGISDRLIIEGDLNTVKTDMNQDLKSIESSGSFKISQKETLKSTTLKKKRRIKKKNILKKKKFQESDSKETVLEKYREAVISNSKEFCWIHVSCALWNPLIDIADFKNKENIRNVEGIDISRFNEQCSICNKTGYGPTSKCEKSGCNNRFHVECARINKLHLESISVNYEYKYFIYCHSHKPHFLVKATEVKKQKKREEILKYAELLERHMDTVYRYDRKHYHKIQGLKINLRDSSALSGRLLLNKKRRRANSKDYNANLIYVHLDKKEKRILALKVRETYNKLNSMEIGIRKDYEKPNKTNNEKTVELKISNLIGLSSKLTQAENKPEGSNNPDSLNVNKPSQPTDDNAIEKRESSLKDIHFMTIPSHQAEQYEIIKKYPKRILFSYKDTLDPKKFPWYMLENTCGLPAKEVYIAYRHIICPDEVSFMKKIQRKTHKKIQQIQTKFINAINKNSMLKRVTHVKDGNKHEYVEYGEDTNLYCFCQRKYLEDDFMVSCSNENNCRFNGWFHPECVEALRALTKEEIEKSDFEFTCEFCLKHTHEDSGEIVNNLIGIPAKDHAEVDCEGLANGGIGGNCDLLKQPFDGKSDGFGSKRSGDCAEDSHK